MPTSLSNHDAEIALRAFLPGFRGELMPFGNRGGFSGSSIWRIEGELTPLCLKAWPNSGTDPAHLENMHALMARAKRAGLTFIPDVRTKPDDSSWVRSSGRIWDLQAWMPGRANFHEQPSTERLTAVVRAMAQIHAAWQTVGNSVQSSPSVHRRLEALREWDKLVATGWRFSPAQTQVSEWRPVLCQAWELAQIHQGRLETMLEAWVDKPVSVQPCIGDVWHDHILFEGERVSGVIDFGAVRFDHPATDVGRLVGSLVGDDESGWATALAAYRAIRPLSWEGEALARLLDRSGVIVSLFNWLRWCGRGERKFADIESVTTRLNSLVNRVGRWDELRAIVPED